MSMAKNGRSGKGAGRRKVAGKRRSPKKAYTGCRELLVVDQKPFLKKALARCQRIRRELAGKQQLLTRFEDSDQSAYRSWLAVEFGALLTDLRGHSDAIGIAEEWLGQIEMAREWMGVQPEHVYEYVRRHREDPEYWDPRYDPDPNVRQDFAEDEEDDDEGEDEECGYDDMDAFFDEILNGMKGAFWDDDGDAEPAGAKRSAKGGDRRDGARSGDPADEAKQLYRRLARRLHPDVCQSANAVTARRWEQLQSAREAGDLDKLRALEAICDADESGLSIQLGLAHLNIWADYHHTLLRPLQARVREVKKDPAWGFSALGESERARLNKELSRQLKHDIKLLHSRREFIEGIIDDYRQLGKSDARSENGTGQQPTPKRSAKTKKTANDKKQCEFAFSF